ncbi:hypothetical protein [Helicobacter pylori]|uniref:hypothetical protein n=1 Tax=Helicobacter pylori TaxID=210 RepID=UPI000950CD10|nr:hypothetical protein [Helicobacter pylori]OLR44010.1 hypothetical protein BIZ44_02850 [Helicobacter pylori]OLR48098.1 hypothetical protein BIZ50_01995 [Helicobacter pylori]
MEIKEENKDKELEKIIVLLCEEGDLSSQKDQIIKDLKEIYKGEYKHKYSKITTIILNSTRDKEQAFMMLTQNIKTLKEIQDNKEVESIKPKLEKLYDHMNLECIRLQDFDEKMSRVKNVSIKLEDELNKNYKKLSEELNKQQTQYITILGIFASIVLTFVGGLAFSTSVLSNIDKANAYRLVFVMAFIALFFGNILYLLFSFLSKISLSEEKKDKQENFFKKPIFWFNLMVIILFVIGFVGERIDGQYKAQISKDFKRPR